MFNVNQYILSSEVPSFDGDISFDKTVEGETIFVSVVEIPPMVSIRKNTDGTIGSIEGYLADLWYLLEEQLKFRTIYLDAGPDFVGSNNNGTWNGMIGSLQSKVADVGLANFGITIARKLVVDFSAAVDAGGSKLIMYQKNDIELVEWTTFVTIFSWKIWLIVGGLWIVAAIFLGHTSEMNIKSSFSDFLFILFAAIIQQGCVKSPKNTSSRILFLWFWIMCVLIYAAYTALLTTELTTSTYKPLSNLKEALEYGFKVSVVKGTYQHQAILQGANLKREFAIVAKMLIDDPKLIVKSIEEGIFSTFDKKTLFFSDENLLKQIASKNCSFSIVSAEAAFDGYSHFAYKKDFELKEILDKRLIRLMSSGIGNKLLHKWIRPSVECRAGNDGVISLGLTKTSFAFAVVIGGMIGSITILLLEMILNRKIFGKNGSNRKFRKTSSVSLFFVTPPFTLIQHLDQSMAKKRPRWKNGNNKMKNEKCFLNI